MKINVNNLPATGKKIVLDMGQHWCVEACNKATDATSEEMSGTLCLTPKSLHVEAKGELNVIASRPCDRCGEMFKLSVHNSFNLRYFPEEALREEELELAVDDLGVGWYVEGRIDLISVVSEIVTLRLPARLVCSDVAGCDSRLISLMGEAQVDRLTGHPSFAALEGFGNGPRG